MVELKALGLVNGSIAFHGKVDAKPETKSTKGNVTVVNAAQPGSPGYFEATFMLNSAFEEAGIEISNVFHWNVVVAVDDHFAPYRAIEDRAARLIAPMLRAVADKLEADLPDFPEKAAAQADEPAAG